MFRKSREGIQDKYLLDSQLEFSQEYLARTQRILFLRGPIFDIGPGPMARVDGFSPTMICDDMQAMNYDDPEAPVTIYIDSPGGDVNMGMVLYDMIRLSKAPVITIAGNCASLATILMAAGSTRIMLPHARAMLHLPQGAFQGDADTMEVRSKELQRVKTELVECYVDCGVTAKLTGRSGGPPTKARVRKQIIKDINRTEYWMTANECVDYGLVDRIATQADLFEGAKQ